MSRSSRVDRPANAVAFTPPYSDRVLEQYVSGSAALWNRRAHLVSAADVSFQVLQSDDTRLDAHLAGLRLGGTHARRALMDAFSSTGFGEMFPAAVLAIEREDVPALDELGAIACSAGELEPPLVSAFGWNEPAALRGLAQKLFRTSTFWQRITLAACGKHRVNPAAWLSVATTSDDPNVRAIAFRIAGDVGAGETRRALISGLASDDETIRFWAARSATLLGDRSNALDVLETFAAGSGPLRDRALQLVLRTVDLPRAHAFLASLPKTPACTRVLITGAGVAGDPKYIPWLIQQMEDDTLARIAGESFGLITGVDLTTSELERPAPDISPERAENDDEDGDDGLLWPDAVRIRSWWERNRRRYHAGVRHFMGEPVSREASLRVLRNGRQRQRIAAAHHLCVLAPGTPLFNTSAPAWRQQKLLAQMS